MPALNAAFIGSAWSLWSATDDRGGLNIVSGDRKIAADIISVLLIRKGEDPVHPQYGLAPDLFEPLSNYAPQYWVHNAQNEIMRWVPGIEKITVSIDQFPDRENKLGANIIFVPKGRADQNLLTFGWYAYTGAIWNQSLDKFMDDVSLNGARFNGFT
ncbi:MAG: GPW/gp25 family protein [Timaviella obliquedivisa GSE-PSE-MK23-08B]|jgi:phage baseplate assembly protein W|nr:GPW/gp25 family protein [Timaviella obliquedivisa GSE-PSE-MK23-08B]